MLTDSDAPDAAPYPAATPPPTRPTAYTPELSRAVCRGIALGYSIRELAARDPRMPDAGTIIEWLADVPAFAPLYERAQELACEHWLGEIRRTERRIATHLLTPAQGRAIIASMQWRMERMHPRRYARAADIPERGQLTLEALVMASYSLGQRAALPSPTPTSCIVDSTARAVDDPQP